MYIVYDCYEKSTIKCYLCQVDKHVPMHLRRKLRPEKPVPNTFEIIPSTGTLQPSQRQNIQVKFMPTEQVETTHYLHQVSCSLFVHLLPHPLHGNTVQR